MPAAAGAAFLAGFPPHPAWPLTFAGAGLYLAALLRCRTPAQAASASLVMRSVWVLPSISYLAGASLAAYVAVAFAHVAAWGLMGLAFWRLRRGAGRPAVIAAFPFLWTLCEWLANTLHFLPSHVLSWWDALATPGVLLAPYTGLYGVSFAAAVLVAAALALLEWRRAAPRERRLLAGGATLWLLALMAPLPLTAMLDAGAGPATARGRYSASLVPRRHGAAAPSRPALRVAAAALEANDSLERYLEAGPWSAQTQAGVERHLAKRLGELLAMIAQASSTAGRPRLLLLPEDAIDLTLRESRSEEAFRRWGLVNNGLLVETYQRLARVSHAAVAAGMTTLRGGGRRNSVALFAPDGSLAGLRDKFHLTPGSERWPLGGALPLWLPFAGDPRFAEPGEQYVPADEPLRLLSMEGWSFGAAVCLEGQMPPVYRGFKAAGADFLVLLSNAHWFRRDPAAYNGQVLQLVRLAAAAYALPVALTGKAGFAGVVDERGRFRGSAAFGPGGGEAIRIETIASPARPETVPSRFGEYYAAISALGLAAWIALAAVARRAGPKLLI